MAVKTFTTGEVLTAADTNTYLANAGLDYVKSQTIGTAVSSVTVTNAFSSTYDNYLILANGGAGSGSAACQTQLGATATGYYSSGYSVTYAGVGSTASDNNATSWTASAVVTTDGINVYLYLNGPNLAKRTYMSGAYIFGNPAGGGDARSINGYLNNATQYTDVKITFGGATMTGGTITVYGYRKA
jgi:hypothetical protein